MFTFICFCVIIYIVVFYLLKAQTWQFQSSLSFFDAFLHALQDGELHSAKDVREWIAIEMNLTESDRSELLPSGRQGIFDNRVHWARTYLNKAGLIETPVRG